MLFKKIFLSLFLILTLLTLGFWSSKISFDNSKWLSKDDHQEMTEQYIREHFNQKNELVIAIKLQSDFFSAPVFNTLFKLDKKINENLNPELYSHPLNISFIFRDTHDSLIISTFKKEWEEKRKSLSQLKEIFKQSFYQGRYISEDHKSFLLILKFSEKESTQENHLERVRLIEGIKKLLDQEPLFAHYKMAGSVKLYYQMNKENKKELGFLISMALATILILLALYYKNLKVIAIVLFSNLLSLTSSLSLFYFFNLPINILTSIIPVLIMAIALADSIHIINRYIFEKEKNIFKWKNFIKFIWRPCFVTSLTTAMGFLSFGNSQIIIIKQLAFIAPAVILFAYLLIIVSNCSLLYILNPKIKSSLLPLDYLKPFLKFQKSISRTLFMMVMILIGSIFIYHYSFTESNFLDSFFKKESFIQKDFAYIDREHGGTGALEIVINRSKDQSESAYVDFKEIENYQKVQELQKAFKEFPGVKRLESYLMPVQMVHQKLRSNSAAHPLTSNELSQEIFFLELSQSAESEDILRPFLSFDEEQKSSRFVLRTQNLSNKQTKELKRKVEKEIKPLGWSVDYAGNSEYFLYLSKLIFDTQIQSLCLAFFMVFLSMWIFYNIRAACLIVLANLIPIWGVLLAIVSFRNPFDFSTILISSIGLGICVDDNIHLIHHVIKSPSRLTLNKVFLHAFRPVVIVSLLFISVFFIFGFSQIVLLQKFGFFSCLIIILSLLTNIFILPSLLPFLIRKTNSHKSQF